MWLETLTLSVTALFAGAALYVSFVEHPARLSCGSAPALAEWRPSYRRGSLMQAPLAIVAALLGLACWWKGGGWLWLVGAILIGSLVPFTIVVIFPTNHQLEDPALDGTSDAARQLLIGWGRLHAVRTALGSAALVVMVFARS
jgi:uncharacterized membrane protein